MENVSTELLKYLRRSLRKSSCCKINRAVGSVPFDDI